MKPRTKIEIVLLVTLAIWIVLSLFIPEEPSLIAAAIIFIPLAFVSHRRWMKEHNASKAKPVWRYAFILCEFGLYALFVAVVIWKLNALEPAFPTLIFIFLLALSYTSSWIRKHIDNSDAQ